MYRSCLIWIRDFISQQIYIQETCVLGCKPIKTLVEANQMLGEKIEEGSTNRSTYQWMMGKLIYISHVWANIAYAISIVSQFIHVLLKSHLEVIFKIIRYLKATLGKGVIFQRNDDLRLEAYTDVDYAWSVVDRKLTNGYYMFVGCNLITWRSKK